MLHVYIACFNTVSKEDPESKSNVFLHLLAQLPSLWQFDEFAAICHGTSNGNLVRGNLMSKRPARHIAPAARGCGCTSHHPGPAHPNAIKCDSHPCSHTQPYPAIGHAPASHAVLRVTGTLAMALPAKTSGRDSI